MGEQIELGAGQYWYFFGFLAIGNTTGDRHERQKRDPWGHQLQCRDAHGHLDHLAKTTEMSNLR